MPLLVETVEPNDDYTEWTMTIRDGIKFHDGTPLDGAAVKFNIDACRAAPLTAGGAARRSATSTADGPDRDDHHAGRTVGRPAGLLHRRLVRLHAVADSGWAACPTSPSAPRASPVYDAALAATPADGDPAAPVGLGAFVFESYTPGNGNVVPRRAQRGLLAGPERHHR